MDLMSGKMRQLWETEAEKKFELNLPRELMWSFIMTSIEFFKEVQSLKAAKEGPGGRRRVGGGGGGGGKFLPGETENFEENTRTFADLGSMRSINVAFLDDIDDAGSNDGSFDGGKGKKKKVEKKVAKLVKNGKTLGNGFSGLLGSKVGKSAFEPKAGSEVGTFDGLKDKDTPTGKQSTKASKK